METATETGIITSLDGFLGDDVRALEAKIRAAGLPPAQQQCLLALTQHVRDAYHTTIARLERESRAPHENATWHVYTCLVPREADEGTLPMGFHAMTTDASSEERMDEDADEDIEPVGKPVMTPQEEEARVFFLFTSYEEAYAFLHTERAPYTGLWSHDGQEIAFHYRIRPYEGYVRREHALFALAWQQHMRTPILFSPYARRAVFIDVIDGLAPGQPIALDDLQIEENGLGHLRFVRGAQGEGEWKLAWNVSLQPLTPSNEGVEPEGNRTIYTYYYDRGTAKAAYLCLNENTGNVWSDVMEREGKFCVRTIAPLVDTRATRLAIEETDVRDGFGFDNAMQGGVLPERLLTAGDVDHLLHVLTNAFGRAELLPRSANLASYEDIPAYPAAWAYPTDERAVLYGSRRQRPHLTLLFTPNGKRKYLTDYANYICQYLTRCYPAFVWRGVRKKEGAR